mmetsp:Transcript_57935/g.129163  ORF Transcript_57935/g.129163 Transcript_57935/m.129163 type:complete len:205 (+) Transcript_57935:307-921(+)
MALPTRAIFISFLRSSAAVSSAARAKISASSGSSLQRRARTSATNDELRKSLLLEIFHQCALSPAFLSASSAVLAKPIKRHVASHACARSAGGFDMVLTSLTSCLLRDCSAESAPSTKGANASKATAFAAPPASSCGSAGAAVVGPLPSLGATALAISSASSRGVRPIAFSVRKHVESAAFPSASASTWITSTRPSRAATCIGV